MAGTLVQFDREQCSGALKAPLYVNGRVLGAASAESIAVPDLANYVLLAGTDDFYANYTTTAAVPTDAMNDGTASELIAKYGDISMRLRRLPSGTGRNISVISAGTPSITASFFL